MMGRWVAIPSAVYHTEIHRCSLCGKMVVNQYWETTEQGKTFKFCDADCEALWHEYWLPRYGESIGLKPRMELG